MSGLVEYGIQTEQSDLRCHVAPATRRIFVFATDDVRKAMATYHFRETTAKQAGVDGITGRGVLVPPEDIPNLRTIMLDHWPWWTWFQPAQTTSEKGAQAVRVVRALLAAGRFPLPISVEEDTDRRVQLAGTDLTVRGTWRIQVKCDYRAGGQPPAGSGYLFIQTAERNPLHQH